MIELVLTTSSYPISRLLLSLMLMLMTEPRFLWVNIAWRCEPGWRMDMANHVVSFKRESVAPGSYT